MLARFVAGELAVSDDGGLLAYAVERDAVGELFVHDGARARRIAEGLASAGVLRIENDRLLFVGGRPGGIAGESIAPLDGSGARCLTHCELRTGTDWAARFEPPTSSGALARTVALYEAESSNRQPSQRPWRSSAAPMPVDSRTFS